MNGDDTGFLRAHEQRRQDLLRRIRDAQRVWTGADASDGIVARELAALEARVASGRVAIGVFGLLKRGKSTLVNALLAHEVSPTGVTPETAVPVVVDHGPHSRVRVHLVDGRVLPVPVDEIRRWTSQEHNEANHLGVTHLEWQLDAAMLAPDVRLVDTPGLDDVDELYTRRTLQQVAEVDAGVLVVSSPPTVGATEVAWLRAVHERHGGRVIVVCNLHESHADDPESREAVVEYVRDRVAQVSPDVTVVPVCALRAARARATGDHLGWVRSGGEDVLAAIGEVAGRLAGARVLDAAESDLERLVELATGQLAVWSGTGATTTGTSSTDVRRVLEGVLGQAEDARLQAHLVIEHLFRDAADRVSRIIGSTDPAAEVTHFAREVEVHTAEVATAVRTRMLRLAADLDLTVPLADGEDLVDAVASRDATIEPARGSGRTIAGVAGSVGLAAAGLALGPVGLLGGAVVGWRLGDLARAGITVGSRREARERIEEVRDAIVSALDVRLDQTLHEIRTAAEARADALDRDERRELADAVDRERLGAALVEAAGRRDLTVVMGVGVMAG